MSKPEVVLVVVGSILAYMIGCGVFYGIGKTKRWDFEDPGPVIGLLLWPMALPALLAAMATERLMRPRVSLPKAQVHK